MLAGFRPPWRGVPHAHPQNGTQFVDLGKPGADGRWPVRTKLNSVEHGSGVEHAFNFDAERDPKRAFGSGSERAGCAAGIYNSTGL